MRKLQNQRTTLRLENVPKMNVPSSQFSLIAQLKIIVTRKFALALKRAAGARRSSQHTAFLVFPQTSKCHAHYKQNMSALSLIDS